ncbi:aspartyl/glutamyl-tRNA amidotransferase subunit A [Aerococcus urinaehominis]|uniref:Glutamyl-tRNA(Gln) amidotransferase subunit A n=1 Tax=Aerococcus urinaehominis TaxID=128944 RepID=A0A109RGT0_9LACT|nr:Asp-tRNA(Asn)/Glu-tRNA(Gln) amidotransferase subunit GatA [Aerococcus urinaehominis]AMB99458.1 aspartyl/glutamyl-tRNA amidotransferase subunit A [Aerococcus urinaehominis]SDM28242.1 aspartyl/glutamyl-tRNA(Asn/Gln) amidotransferase subunit A [Aerococcus urinaehominis]
MNRYEETFRGLNEKLVAGELTSVELVEKTLERIKNLDQTYNAFITLNEEKALEAAKASDERGYTSDRPLQGIPIAIKDNILTDGLLTTAASKMLSNFEPIFSATVVEKLEAAGAIIIGKTNLDEFAMGASTETSYYGNTLNPWDTDRVPGGSSGGSAAAVASGEVVASLGTDTGGSIRQPSAFTDLVGMKPTYGRISRWGVIAFGSSLDQVGPMTRTVEDNALLLEVLSGADQYDSTVSDQPIPNYVEEIKKGVKGLKIAVPKEFFGETVDPEVCEIVKGAINTLKELGAEVEEISLSHIKYGVPAYYIISSAEASSNLQRFDGIRYGYRSPEAQNLEEVYIKSRSEGFGLEVKRRIMLGSFALSSGNYEAFFKKASQVRRLLRQAFEKTFAEYDLIVGPVATHTAGKFGVNDENPAKTYQEDILTVPVNLAGLPGMSVPAGFASDGLPVGLQIIGNYFDEATMYRAAYALEEATDFSDKHPE